VEKPKAQKVRAKCDLERLCLDFQTVKDLLNLAAGYQRALNLCEHVELEAISFVSSYLRY
jgi:hypothetical protein